MEITQLFVCENFYFEYKKVIAVEHPEFNLHVYPDLCANTQLKSEPEEFFASLWVHGESYLLANNTCPILNFIPETNKAIITGKYCFSHLVCDDFIKHLLDEGCYLVSSSWLVNWEDNLAEMGFKQSTARIFFQEFAKKLVFLDSQIVENALELIHALGVYLDLPYTIIPVGTQQRGNLFSQIKTKVHFNKVENQYINSINELRMQCSEYAAIFDVHSKILSFTGIRDVIDKLSELFLMIFGAKKFKFWHWDSVQIPQEIKELDWAGENYILLSDEGSFI